MMKEIDQERIIELKHIIEEAEKITIAVHVHPDGDALGSAVGLKHFIEDNFNKSIRIITSDHYTKPISFIIKGKDESEYLSYDRDSDEIKKWFTQSDTLFCLDFNHCDRSGDIKGLIEKFSGKRVLIDHHLNPQTEAFDLCFSETQISSTSEFLFLILNKLECKTGLQKECMEGILTGITTDTNNFANSVFPTTLKVCSEIIESGVDRDAIINHIYNEYRENRLRLMGHILKDLMVTTDYGLAYIILDKDVCREYEVSDGEMEGFVNLPLAVKEIKMSIFLREEAGYYRVSLRSKKGISANRCSMEFFNGGGHEQAAGGRLYWPKDIKDKSEAAEYVANAAKPYLNEI